MQRTSCSRGAVVLELALALPLAVGLIYLALARSAGTWGLVQVQDDQVAVVVDYRSGASRVIDRPGVRLFVPWLQEVYCFDKSPEALRLQEGNESPGTRPRLLVRASDGSSFWFKTYTIQYSIRPDAADRVLQDSGPGEGYKEFLVNTFARSVLRDEFGRYGVDEIVDPTNLRQATERSHERLDRLLEPHGLRVIELSAPNPGFDPEYERAIERRKVHNQQVAYLTERLASLQAERDRRLADARKASELEMQEWETRLRIERVGVEEELIRARGEAEEAFARRVAEGRAELERKLALAEARRAQIQAEVAGLQQEIGALEVGGEQLVRRELVNRLAGIPFKLAPYAARAARGTDVSGAEVEGTR